MQATLKLGTGMKIYLIVLFLLTVAPATAQQEKITSHELNRKLLSYTNSYQEAISETVDKIIADDLDSTSRMLYQTVKVFYTHSAISIATRSDSVQQLMDMIVMLRLQKLVWENGGNSICRKEHARLMAKTIQKLEDDLQRLATQVFTNKDLSYITSLAENWKEQNPDREYMAFVRFQDFGHSEDKAHIERIIGSGGLFSTISEANLEIEEARLTAERAMFLANHMPILMEWQSELFLYKVLSTDEVIEMINQGRSLSLNAERLSITLESLPGFLQTTLEENKGDVHQITENLEQTSENLRQVISQVAPMFEDSQTGNDNLSLKNIESIMIQALSTSKELVRLSDNVNRFTYDREYADHFQGILSKQLMEIDEQFNTRILQIEDAVNDHTNRIFFLLLILVVVIFGFYILANRTLIKYRCKVQKDVSLL